MEVRDIRVNETLEEGTPLLHEDGLIYKLSSTYFIPKRNSFGVPPSNMILRIDRIENGKKYSTQDLLKNFIGIVVNETPKGKIFDRNGKGIKVSIIL